MAEAPPKPPYVRFEVRSLEDREATIEAGHYVGRDVVFAIVTPAGTRDQIEREAEAWLDNVREGVNQDRIPAEWLPIYEKALQNFRESRDTPEFGTPVRDWPGASPAQIKLLLDINVRTIEELAVANEETVGRIGMGGRALKAKAAAWLEASEGPGKLAEEAEALRIEIGALKERDEKREAEFKKLQSQVAALTPVKEKA